jgi:hypothetical protein
MRAGLVRGGMHSNVRDMAARRPMQANLKGKIEK